MIASQNLAPHIEALWLHSGVFIFFPLGNRIENLLGFSQRSLCSPYGLPGTLFRLLFCLPCSTRYKCLVFGHFHICLLTTFVRCHTTKSKGLDVVHPDSGPQVLFVYYHTIVYIGLALFLHGSDFLPFQVRFHTT